MACKFAHYNRNIQYFYIKYSQGKEEDVRAGKAAQNGGPLGGGELRAKNLHAGKDDQRQKQTQNCRNHVGHFTQIAVVFSCGKLQGKLSTINSETSVSYLLVNPREMFQEFL